MLLRNYVVGGASGEGEEITYLLTGKGGASFPGQGFKYSKILMGFFLQALWALSSLSGFEMKAV